MTADHAFYKFEQVRVTHLLATGATDPSATPVVSTVPKDITFKPIYKAGEEAEQTGGGDIFCTLTEQDQPKGYDADLTLATIEYELKQAIAGGSLKTAQAVTTGWEFPDTVPGPFKMEVWVPAYDVSESTEGMTDGYLKITCNYCIGSVGNRDHGEKKWGEDSFSIKARRNPSTGDPAFEEEEIATIT